MERLKQLRADLESWLSRLAPRERVMVSAAAAAVVIFVVGMSAMAASAGARAREARISQKTKVLQQVAQLSGDFRRIQAERAAMEARLKGQPVQLMSHVSQTGAGLGIEVTDLRPAGAPVEADGVSEESVEVSLVRIELAKLGQLVQGLERSPGLVKVRRVRIATRSDDAKLVDATVLVATYHVKG
jgi:general secretion pathway protein M